MKFEFVPGKSYLSTGIKHCTYEILVVKRTKNIIYYRMDGGKLEKNYTMNDNTGEYIKPFKFMSHYLYKASDVKT